MTRYTFLNANAMRVLQAPIDAPPATWSSEPLPDGSGTRYTFSMALPVPVGIFPKGSAYAIVVQEGPSQS